MREVTKEQFFAVIGPLNVHPRIIGKYPYISEFCYPDGRLVGKIDSEHRYWLV